MGYMVVSHTRTVECISTVDSRSRHSSRLKVVSPTTTANSDL